MALSYTQKTSDNSLITKYVRKYCPISFLIVTHAMCVDSNPCTTNSALISSRTVCIRRASLPLTVSLVHGRTRQTSLLRYLFRPMTNDPSLILQSRFLFFFQSIVAIKAASEIFRILGDNDKSTQYNVRYLVLYRRCVVNMSTTEFCHLLPGTMAESCALAGQDPLYPFVWGHLIVSVWRGGGWSSSRF